MRTTRVSKVQPVGKSSLWTRIRAQTVFAKATWSHFAKSYQRGCSTDAIHRMSRFTAWLTCNADIVRHQSNVWDIWSRRCNGQYRRYNCKFQVWTHKYFKTGNTNISGLYPDLVNFTDVCSTKRFVHGNSQTLPAALAFRGETLKTVSIVHTFVCRNCKLKSSMLSMPIEEFASAQRPRAMSSSNFCNAPRPVCSIRNRIDFRQISKRSLQEMY